MKYLLLASLLFSVTACSEDPDDIMAVGTLERDRTELRAPVGETVITREVEDGARVRHGQVLIMLDTATADARLRQADAMLAAAKARLAEIQRGARSERIEQLQAELARAHSERQRAERNWQRSHELAADNLISDSELDTASNALRIAKANVEQAHAALQEQLNGATPEELDQAEANTAAATARRDELAALRDQLVIRAPFDGRVEQVLVETGDRVAANALLVTLFPDGAPYARVFIPAGMKQVLSPGDIRAVNVDGHGCRIARFSYIASEASFTPYFTLREQDRGRLVYIAKLRLDETATDLPTGLPVDVLDREECPQP
jgi:HlyD family secretion protein